MIDRERATLLDDVGEALPHVAIQTHLDGNPEPRPDEIVRFNEVREESGLDEMTVAILLPVDDGWTTVSKRKPGATSQPFPDCETHWWKIGRRDGELYCEAADVVVEVVP